MKWEIRNDPWLDNGLEVFSKVTESIAEQFPNILEIKVDYEELTLKIYEEENFIEKLSDEIKKRTKDRLYYYVDKDSLKIKPFVIFNKQPSSQYPLIFKNGEMKDFLKGLFTTQSVKGQTSKKSCIFCGRSTKRNLTQSIYPFATKIRSLSGIRTKWKNGKLKELDEYIKICDQCYFLGAIAWIDDTLPYLCNIDQKSVILLPAPIYSNLVKLKQVKSISLAYGDGKTNVRFKKRHAEETYGNSEGKYSLLLAFIERILYEIAEKEDVMDLLSDIKIRISERWFFITIPQGKMKNIMISELILNEPTFKLLAKLSENGLLPFTYVFYELEITDEKGKVLPKETQLLRERLSEALLTDNFNLFAIAFAYKPKRLLGLYKDIERDIEKIVKIWRWSEVNQDVLEILKKSGRAFASIAISSKHPSILYSLERARSSSDLLEVLKNCAHKLIGLDKEEAKHISLNSLEQLTELILNTNEPKTLADIKNTLLIFANISYTKQLISEQSTQSEEN